MKRATTKSPVPAATPSPARRKASASDPKGAKKRSAQKAPAPKPVPPQKQPRYDWSRALAMYCDNQSLDVIARALGCSKASVVKHRDNDRWDEKKAAEMARRAGTGEVLAFDPPESDDDTRRQVRRRIERLIAEGPVRGVFQFKNELQALRIAVSAYADMGLYDHVESDAGDSPRVDVAGAIMVESESPAVDAPSAEVN